MTNNYIICKKLSKHRNYIRQLDLMKITFNITLFLQVQFLIPSSSIFYFNVPIKHIPTSLNNSKDSAHTIEEF